MAGRDIDVFDDMDLSWNIKNRCLEPLVSIREDDREITVTVDLPCVRKEDISVSTSETSLEVKAKMERSYRLHRWGTIQRGVEFNSFHKIIRFPDEVVPEEVKAKFADGILSIKLPKRITKRIVDVE